MADEEEERRGNKTEEEREKLGRVASAMVGYGELDTSHGGSAQPDCVKTTQKKEPVKLHRQARGTLVRSTGNIPVERTRIMVRNIQLDKRVYRTASVLAGK